MLLEMGRILYTAVVIVLLGNPSVDHDRLIEQPHSEITTYLCFSFPVSLFTQFSLLRGLPPLHVTHVWECCM